MFLSTAEARSELLIFAWEKKKKPHIILQSGNLMNATVVLGTLYRVLTGIFLNAGHALNI